MGGTFLLMPSALGVLPAEDRQIKQCARCFTHRHKGPGRQVWYALQQGHQFHHPGQIQIHKYHPNYSHCLRPESCSTAVGLLLLEGCWHLLRLLFLCFHCLACASPAEASLSAELKTLFRMASSELERFRFFFTL